jgi:hypothetical protein
MHIIRYLGSVLAPSTVASLLRPLAIKANWENDLSTVPIGLTNSKYDQLVLFQN